MPPAPPRFAAPAAIVTRAASGLEISSTPPLGSYPRHLGEVLEAAAREHPDRCFLAERPSSLHEWRRMTYGEFHTRVSTLADALLDLGLAPDRPLLVLADNGIAHAQLMFAAMHVGIPVASVSTAYSTMSSDHVRLCRIVSRVRPGAIFVDRLAPHTRALERLDLHDTQLIVGDDDGEPAADRRIGLSDLVSRPARAAAHDAADRVGPDTVAKILFTSGSTGEPKGVLVTQRMMCSNQAATAQVLPFLADDAQAGFPPVLCDWLPWSHTFGSNSNLNLVLFHAGTLFIDAGKPTPAGIDATIANLREVAPTLYFNVPRGFDMLAPRLETDAELARIFFSRLRLLFYAGAALSQATWARLQAIAKRTRGAPIPLITGWGATETAPAATMLHWSVDAVGNIGLPLPGTTVKLVPSGDAFELCVKGPNVTPGYFEEPTARRVAVDADGYYHSGDAGCLADPAHPELGLMYQGRIAEDFKLSSGTWVAVNRLRLLARSALSPWVRDCVVTGHDRSELGLLLFLDEDACRSACAPALARAGAAELARQATVRRAIALGLARHNLSHPGSSSRFARALVLADPPSLDDGEITDKGYVNQRAVLHHRAAEIERLFDDCEAEVVRPVVS